MKYILEVRRGEYWGELVEEIERTPIHHSGWQAVRYKGKQYKVWGGIRNNLRIII